MSLPKYPAYKDSGVSWLGEVPAHWLTKKVKFLTSRISSGKTPLGGSETYVNSGVVFLRSQNVYDEGLRLEDVVFISDVTDELMANSRVECGDILLNITGASIGRSCLVPSNFPSANVNQHVCVIRPVAFQSALFISWVFKSYVIKRQIEFAQNGAAREGLNFEQIGGMVMSLPPLNEQESIAAFLDRETAKIDALIAEQEKLIALLAEKRQATISRAVTRGLDPNVPLKESGVPWLGKVPAHWEVLQIKRLSPVQRGASPRPIDDPKFFDDDGDYSWVRIADVSASDGFLNETTQRMSLLGSSLSVKIEPGELFVSIAGTVGKPCISNIKACIHDGFVYFPKLSLNPRFLFRVFEAGQCYAGLGKFGTQLNLNTDTIGSIKLAVPSDGEVIEICKFLDFELGKIDELLSEQEKAVALLKERRASLISAAVTGKIDVQGLAA